MRRRMKFLYLYDMNPKPKKRKRMSPDKYFNKKTCTVRLRYPFRSFNYKYAHVFEAEESGLYNYSNTIENLEYISLVVEKEQIEYFLFWFEYKSKSRRMMFHVDKRISSNIEYEYCIKMLKPLIRSLSRTLKYHVWDSTEMVFGCKIINNMNYKMILDESIGRGIDPYSKHQIVYYSGKVILETIYRSIPFIYLQN